MKQPDTGSAERSKNPTRIHLRDYTPDEVRGMEAPGILSALACQGLGAKWEEGRNCLFLSSASGLDLAEYEKATGLLRVYQDGSISSDPGAAMRALEELKGQIEAKGIGGRVCIDHWLDEEGWTIDVSCGAEAIWSCGKSIPLAIARACALWGLATLKEKDASISYKEPE